MLMYMRGLAQNVQKKRIDWLIIIKELRYKDGGDKSEGSSHGLRGGSRSRERSASLDKRALWIRRLLFVVAQLRSQAFSSLLRNRSSAVSTVLSHETESRTSRRRVCTIWIQWLFHWWNYFNGCWKNQLQLIKIKHQVITDKVAPYTIQIWRCWFVIHGLIYNNQLNIMLNQEI